MNIMVAYLAAGLNCVYTHFGIIRHVLNHYNEAKIRFHKYAHQATDLQ